MILQLYVRQGEKNIVNSTCNTQILQNIDLNKFRNSFYEEYNGTFFAPV